MSLFELLQALLRNVYWGNLGQHNFNFALSFFARTSSFATNPYIKGLELKGGFGFSITQYPACKKLEHELFPLQRANNIPFSSVTFYRTPFFCIHCVKTIKLLLSLSQIFQSPLYSLQIFAYENTQVYSLCKV